MQIPAYIKGFCYQISHGFMSFNSHFRFEFWITLLPQPHPLRMTTAGLAISLLGAVVTPPRFLLLLISTHYAICSVIQNLNHKSISDGKQNQKAKTKTKQDMELQHKNNNNKYYEDTAPVKLISRIRMAVCEAAGKPTKYQICNLQERYFIMWYIELWFLVMLSTFFM